MLEQREPLTKLEAAQLNPIALAFVGDTVYSLGGLYSRVVKSATIVEIIVNFCGVSELLVTDENIVTFQDSIDIFYLTRKEAEDALAEKIKARNN